MRNEFSAGGIVFTKDNKDILVLVSQHSAHHGWVFPKGHVGDSVAKETPEEAALREVHEETGIVGEILAPLSPIFYWYSYEEEKRHKKVQYFLMKFVSGNTSQHDFEMEKVEWILANEVENRLTFKGDKKAWEEAREILKKYT